MSEKTVFCEKTGKGGTMRSEREVTDAIERYSDTVLRLCTVYLKNGSDAEDIFQTVFLKYALHDGPFQNPEHEKAWLIRVTVNRCRDLQRAGAVRTYTPLEDLVQQPQQPDEGWQEGQPVLRALMSLPEKYRTVLVLNALEGQPVDLIASELRLTASAVKMRLKRGRELLQTTLAKEDIHV